MDLSGAGMTAEQRASLDSVCAAMIAMQAWATAKDTTITAMTSALSALTDTVTALASLVSTIGQSRIKYAKVLATNSSGVYTGAMGGADLFTGEPAIEITCKQAADNFDWRYQLTGSAAAGWGIVVTFTRRNNTVLGNLTTLLAGISLINTPVVTGFTLIASEQTP